MNELLKTDDCIVSFIDILGASNLIKKDVDGSLNLVHSVYKESLDMYEEVFSNKVKLSIAIFSDNIVVARKISEEAHLESAFRFVELMSAIIQGNYLFKGVLARGGIARGHFFKDDIMVWGDGLVKAYNLENSVAIYPRIVIDPDLISDLGMYNGKCKGEHWLKQDIDGITYIDYLQQKYIKEYEFALLRELGKYDDRVVECKNDTRIMQKNIWQLNYIKTKLAENKDESIRN